MSAEETPGTAVGIPEPTEIMLPHSGEVIPFDDAAACARAHLEIALLQAQLAKAKKALALAIVAESERQGTKTLRFAGVSARVKPQRDIVWDLEVLERLRDLGLPEERWNELVSTEVSYKVSAAVAKQIADANPRYAEVVKRAREDEDRDPSVEISR